MVGFGGGLEDILFVRSFILGEIFYIKLWGMGGPFFFDDGLAFQSSNPVGLILCAMDSCQGIHFYP